MPPTFSPCGAGDEWDIAFYRPGVTAPRVQLIDRFRSLVQRTTMEAIGPQ
jgi:hypothetical protein